jgi:soluble lytic murein transglycosylase-like protein
LGATLAAAAFGAVALQPRAGGEPPSLPRVETWISAACGGDEPCERWDSARRLSTILSVRMPELPEDDRLRLATAIAEEAAAAKLDPLFVLAVIEVESGFDHEAVSHRGAQGLMQLRPSTLRGEAERSRLVLGDPDEPVDPVVNVRLGIRYYRRLLDAFRQNPDLALMAYNAGPQRISRLIREEGGVPDRYRAYARRVNAEFRRLRGDRSRVALAPGAALDAAER